MSFMNPEATRKPRKNQRGNVKLISKTKGTSVSTKTKEVIVDANVCTKKNNPPEEEQHNTSHEKN